MKTVNTTFPIYNSTDNRDYDRTGQLRPLYCPKHQLPPFQFEAKGVTSIDAVRLYNCGNAGYTDITSYFDTLPATYSLSSNPYVQYKGDALKTLLPTGSHYLRLEADTGEYFYSEHIRVEDIYPDVEDSWDSSNYDTTTYRTGNRGFSSLISDGTGAVRVRYGNLAIPEGSVWHVWVNVTLNSGTAPTIEIADSTLATAISNVENLADGFNFITLTATTPDYAGFIVLRNADGVACDLETDDFVVMKDYSDDFTRVKFSNTKDLPTQTNEATILYQDSWFDQVWFKTKLNTPEHETTRIGAEKNGVFIAEKIISIFRYKIVDYIGRALYRALYRMPLHDDIQITDEVGNYYNVGHDVQVDPISWDYYDMGTFTMTFNDGASYFEGNADNMAT